VSNLVKKDGFDFAFEEGICASCQGQCCIGERGYIWINKEEIEALAKHLNLGNEEFISKYLFKVGYKYSIKEVELLNNSYACCFFNLIEKKCSIYEYRPTQCRSFPFWDYFKKNKEEVYKECPAIRDI